MAMKTYRLSELLVHTPRPVEVNEHQEYREIGIRSHGRGIFHKPAIRGATLGEKKVFHIEPGDFIVNIVFAWEGAVAIAGTEEQGTIASHRFPTFRTKPDLLDARYLLYFFRTPKGLDLLLRVSPGGAGRNRTLSRERFMAEAVTIPSVADQRRIVERLDDLSTAIESAKQLRVEARQASKALVGQTVARAIEQGGNRGWPAACLGDLLLDADYGTSERTTDDPSGRPVLRMGNIQDGRLVLGDLRYLPLAADAAARLKLLPGDILVNRTNSAELVGKCAVFEEVGEYLFASYIIRIRVDTARVLPQFVARFINSPAGRRYMFKKKKQMTGQANINLKTLRALPLRVPSLEDQRELLARIDRVEQLVAEVKLRQEKSDVELDAMIPAALARAFPQPPSVTTERLQPATSPPRSERAKGGRASSPAQRPRQVEL